MHRETAEADEGERLRENIEQLHTTQMGILRIRKNLGTDAGDVVNICRSLILNEKCRISRRGKNWYCETDNIRLTVNSYSYTIITAHRV